MNNPPKLRSGHQKFYQGYFTPSNPRKYVGNLDKIIYRSSWEKHFMNICDKNDRILKWSSEPFPIFYISPLDNKQHRYYIDFWILLKNKEDKLKKILIEIKPYSQTQIPNIKGRKTNKKRLQFIKESETFLINQAKWTSALKFCKDSDSDVDFMIITEKTLDLFNENF